jgi:hypothetical protein
VTVPAAGVSGILNVIEGFEVPIRNAAPEFGDVSEGDCVVAEMQAIEPMTTVVNPFGQAVSDVLPSYATNFPRLAGVQGMYPSVAL